MRKKEIEALKAMTDRTRAMFAESLPVLTSKELASLANECVFHGLDEALRMCIKEMDKRDA